MPQIDRVELLGTTGTALTDLRPAGVARFGQDRVDVVSEGDFVPVGSTLKVLRVEGSRVTVRKVESSGAQASSPAAAGATAIAGSQTLNADTATLADNDQSPADDGRKEA